MLRWPLQCSFVILICLTAQAQRGGRADSSQNYSHSAKPSDPTLSLRGNGRWVYRRLSEIRELNSVTDVKTLAQSPDPALQTRHMPG